MRVVASLCGGSLMAFLLTSCFPIDHVGSYRCADLQESFFSKSTTERMERFSSYPVDEQYAIYICGTQAHEPPAIYLAEPFAREGSKAAGLLEDRLAKTGDDLTIRDIVAVFAEMSWRKTYDVAGNARLMKLIESKTSQMKDEQWRAITKRKVHEIKAAEPQANATRAVAQSSGTASK